VTELRVSIPLAIGTYHLPPFYAWLWSVLGTYAVMVIIVLLIEPIARWLSRICRLFERFFNWLFERTRGKAHKKMERFGSWAVFIIAATPVPIIGGMSAAVVAFVFGVSPKKSLPLMLGGTMLSGAIVLILSVGII
jgi:uncharacterized membrane protein